MTVVLRHTGDVTEAGPFKLTPRGLLVTGEPSYEEWQSFGRFLTQTAARVNIWLGDWLNYGESRWGDMYTQAIELTGLDYQTLANAKWVAGKVDFSRRREKLCFATHAEVASLPPAEADAILARAESESLSQKEVRAIVRDVRAALSPRQPPPFVITDELDVVIKWLVARRESWPAEHRHGFTALVARAIEHLELPDVDHGGAGPRTAPADSSAA